MRRIWSGTAGTREPRPGKETQHHVAKVEERLAELRARGASLEPQRPRARTLLPEPEPGLAPAPAPPPVPEHAPPDRPAAEAPNIDETMVLEVESLAAPAPPAADRPQPPPLPPPPPQAPPAGGVGGKISQPPMRVRRIRIGEVLLNRGLIAKEQLDQALEVQRRTGERLGSVLVSQGFISVYEMLSALAEQLGIEVILQDKIEIDPSARDVLPIDVIRRHEVVPLFASEKVLRIAMADPTNLALIDELRFRSGRWIQVVVAAEATVRALIADAFSSESLMSEIMSDGEIPDVEQVELEEDREGDKHNIYELMHESTDRPVVNFVNFLLTDSVRRRASDVHIEPYESSLRIRFRVDGELQTVVSPPQRLHVPVVSRIKVMAGMDISKRRVAQDGHLAVRYSGQIFHYRVSTLPTVFGEKCVLRLLTKEADLADLERIGLPPDEKARLRRAISAPQGLVLVTGPTGSGKTTTVHAALNAIAKPTINVTTLEDPVEATLPGINHVQITEQAGVSFADALRALLRQDPDVVFVGEMRDSEVSSIAIRASLTGHLVLSTLHTNSALESFDRLDDVGVERYLVAATIQTVVAQRLLKRICPACAEPVRPEDLKEVADLPAALSRMAGLGLPQALFRGRGCDECGKTGYKRRTAVYEVLPIDRDVREALRRKLPLPEVARLLQERGFRTLYENGLRLCTEGVTTLMEVHRVLAPED